MLIRWFQHSHCQLAKNCGYTHDRFSFRFLFESTLPRKEFGQTLPLLDLTFLYERTNIESEDPAVPDSRYALGLRFLSWSLVMTPAFSPCLNRSDWRTLYRAAILETNTDILPQRVSAAEEAVRARGREIFYADGTLEEKEDLEDALYALRALRTAWQHSEDA